MSTLHVEGLRVQHVGPVDLAVQAGECVVLTGASGAGKSLLLRGIADVLPHEGTCRLDGVPATEIPPARWRRQVGLLPAEPQWWAEAVGAHFPEPDAALLRRLGFEPGVLDWSVARCSTGERQRLGLARLLANRPRCLLLDEPTASLDPDSTRRVEAILADYRREQGAPVLWVTHDRDQAARVAVRACRLTESGLEELAPSTSSA